MPNCYLLKSHRPWIKQDALRKSEVEDYSSAKYVPPHRRHIKGKGKLKKNNSRHYKRNLQKPISNHGYEGLLSLMQCMLRRMDNMNKTCKPPPRVKQVWVRNDETIHPLRGSGLT
jgi:hypothetical protein